MEEKIIVKGESVMKFLVYSTVAATDRFLATNHTVAEQSDFVHYLFAVRDAYHRDFSDAATLSLLTEQIERVVFS